MLVASGVGIDVLIHAAKRAYLTEAMDAVTRLDGRANISRLSVATGMTRKEVSALLKHAENVLSTSGARGQHRALRVLKGWMTDSRFRNRKGRPCELSYRGNLPSFSQLVRLYAGDVTPKSVLRELQRMEVIAITGAGRLRLRSTRSRNNMEMNYRLADLASLFEEFAFSAIHADDKPPTSSSMFGYKRVTASSARDAAHLMRRFSSRATALLEDFQRWALAQKTTESLSRPSSEARKLGLGIYLVSTDSRLERRAIRSPIASRGSQRRSNRHSARIRH